MESTQGMINTLNKYYLSKHRDYHFSILIPTWNNLGYLKNCIESINEHSFSQHQIIVFVNEGSDGTLEWLDQHRPDNLDYVHSPVNVGICYGMNFCRSMVKSDYIVYMNDDMYVLPAWDKELSKVIHSLDTRMFMLSSTMIEPVPTGNNCVIVKNYGSDLESFKKEELLRDYGEFRKPDWIGSTWPPTVLHLDAWDMVGGFSTEYSPGMYSDPDLSFKLLHAGVREFIGVGASLVYHFGSKSTGKVHKNKGRKTFLAKWGISSRDFRRTVLKIGENYHGSLPDPDYHFRNRFINRVKRILNSWD